MNEQKYKFTVDWFEWAPEVWTQFIPHLPDNKKFLEIGSYEGRSSVWMIEHMMVEGSKLFCIDTWEGGAEHKAANIDMESVEERFHHNITVAQKKFPGRKVYSFRGTSAQTLGGLNASERDLETFDWIYIDGSHHAKDVMSDACAAWPLVKNMGFIVFDDYLWGSKTLNVIHAPKIAIDMFTTMFSQEAAIVHVGQQLIVRKMK